MNPLNAPVTPSWPHDRPLAKGGYVCYLPHPERHTNAATSRPGWGATPRAAAEDACYWANQAPWCVVVTMDRCPKWAVPDGGVAVP